MKELWLQEILQWEWRITMSVKDLVDKLVQGSHLESEDAFKSAMADKVGAALETKRQEVANTFVKNIPEVEEDAEEV